jgi:putative serine protease PepD
MTEPNQPNPNDPQQQPDAPQQSHPAYQGYPAYQPPPAAEPQQPAYQPPEPQYPFYAEQSPGAFGPAAEAHATGEQPQQHAPQAAPRPAAGRRTVLAAAVIAALIGGGVGAGTVALVRDDGSSAPAAGLAFSTQQAPAAKVDGTVTAAAAKIGPSVVTINVTSAQESDTGSGVIIRQDGYILTNNHVISTATGGNGTIKVTLADGRTVSATVVGTDPSDDLAVLKVKLTGLTAATFASSSALQVGQTVVAVGAPLGLSDTVTAGIVSNTARPVTTGDSNNDQAVFNAVQTDAAINPGNSGGPLVNLNGDVVGINAAIATDQSNGGLQVPGQQSSSGNIGIGFAIPSDEASRIATELISTGKATHAVLGVSVGGGTAATQSSGAVIRSVTSGSPADKAGLRIGDVVTALAGQRIDEADALVAAVRSHAPGQQVKLSYTRGGRSTTVTLTLGESAG